MRKAYDKWLATQRHLATAKGITDIIEDPDDLAEGSEWLFPLLKGKDVLSGEAQAILKRAESFPNRLIRETNIKGRGYSFEVLKARTLYRSVNLRKVDAAGMLEQYGPAVNSDFVLFYSEGDEIDNMTKRTNYEKCQRKALAWDEAIDDETVDYYSWHADYDEDDNGTMEVPPDLTVYLDDYEE